MESPDLQIIDLQNHEKSSPAQGFRFSRSVRLGLMLTTLISVALLLAPHIHSFLTRPSYPGSQARTTSFPRPVSVNTVMEGKVYTSTLDGHVAVLHEQDGTLLWQEHFSDLLSVQVLHANLYVTTQDGNVFAYAPTQHHLSWHLHLSAPAFQPPLLTEDFLAYLTQQGEISVLRRKDGSLLWHT
jgi:outer membrane protein assembly factor BamB